MRGGAAHGAAQEMQNAVDPERSDEGDASSGFGSAGLDPALHGDEPGDAASDASAPAARAARREEPPYTGLRKVHH